MGGPAKINSRYSRAPLVYPVSTNAFIRLYENAGRYKVNHLVSYKLQLLTLEGKYCMFEGAAISLGHRKAKRDVPPRAFMQLKRLAVLDKAHLRSAMSRLVSPFVFPSISQNTHWRRRRIGRNRDVAFSTSFWGLLAIFMTGFIWCWRLQHTHRWILTAIVSAVLALVMISSLLFTAPTVTALTSGRFVEFWRAALCLCAPVITIRFFTSFFQFARHLPVFFPLTMVTSRLFQLRRRLFLLGTFVLPFPIMSVTTFPWLILVLSLLVPVFGFTSMRRGYFPLWKLLLHRWTRAKITATVDIHV